MINQITIHNNIGILIKKIPGLSIGQRVIIRYPIWVIMVGLMRLKIKMFFIKLRNQRLYPNMLKRFKQPWFSKEK
jgi:hypothetical protein